MKSLCNLPENMGIRGPKSVGKRPADSPTEATDQKVRGSNPLGRATKSAETVCFCGFSYFLRTFKRLPISLTQTLTHTGISPDSTG